MPLASEDRGDRVPEVHRTLRELIRSLIGSSQMPSLFDDGEDSVDELLTVQEETLMMSPASHPSTPIVVPIHTRARGDGGFYFPEHYACSCRLWCSVPSFLWCGSSRMVPDLGPTVLRHTNMHSCAYRSAVQR